MATTPEKLRTLRQQKELSQEEVAKVLGITRATYIQIEKGARDLKISELMSLCSLFEVSPGAFFNMEKPQGKVYEVCVEEAKPDYKSQERTVRISVPQNKVEIFKEVLIYILKKVGAKPSVGETVLYKLLYFIDFDYYEKYEEQLIGAVYIKNHYGPTPVEFSKVVEGMIEAGEIVKIPGKYFHHPQKKYIPTREPNLGLLNAEQIKHIDGVLDRLSDMNAADLSNYSHRDVPWISAEQGERLEYEAVFYRTAETSVRHYDDTT